MELSGKQRRHLRALGHHLKPVVHIGLKDLSDAVLEKVDAELGHHELIKVKCGDNCSLTPKEVGAALEEKLEAHCAQVIGKTVLLYREHPEDPVIRLPLRA